MGVESGVVVLEAGDGDVAIGVCCATSFRLRVCTRKRSEAGGVWRRWIRWMNKQGASTIYLMLQEFGWVPM